MLRRPTLFVLAGVNGAGKSSVLGAVLKEKGLDWFNPDTFSRALVETTGRTKEEADAAAWAYGKKRLERAIRRLRSYAFETTLGGRTITRLIRVATRTHDVTVVYCGLDSVERHIARVKLRTNYGGHDIPEERISQRYASAPFNLIALMPKLYRLQIYDNSRDAEPGTEIAAPTLLVDMAEGRILTPKPDDRNAMAETPDWAKPLLEAALKLDEAKAKRRNR